MILIFLYFLCFPRNPKFRAQARSNMLCIGHPEYVYKVVNIDVWQPVYVYKVVNIDVGYPVYVYKLWILMCDNLYMYTSCEYRCGIPCICILSCEYRCVTTCICILSCEYRCGILCICILSCEYRCGTPCICV